MDLDTGLHAADWLRIGVGAASLLLAVLSIRLALWVRQDQRAGTPVVPTPLCWAVSYAMFALYVAVDIFSHLGDLPLSFQTPMYGTAIVAGWYACWHVRNKVLRARRNKGMPPT